MTLIKGSKINLKYRHRFKAHKVEMIFSKGKSKTWAVFIRLFYFFMITDSPENSKENPVVFSVLVESLLQHEKVQPKVK